MQYQGFFRRRNSICLTLISKSFQNLIFHLPWIMQTTAELILLFVKLTNIVWICLGNYLQVFNIRQSSFFCAEKLLMRCLDCNFMCAFIYVHKYSFIFTWTKKIWKECLMWFCYVICVIFVLALIPKSLASLCKTGLKIPLRSYWSGYVYIYR